MSEPYYEDDLVTLYHGDCREVTDEIDFDNLGLPDLVVTDPPYGETSLAWDSWPNGWPTVVADYASSMWCFGSMRMFLDRRDEFAMWKYAQEIVWQKHAGTGFQSDRFKRVHEFATHWYRGDWSSIHKDAPKVRTAGPLKGRTIKRGPTQHYGKQGEVGWIDEGERIMHSVIEMRNMHGLAIHPTEKPTGLLEILIAYGCPIGGVVFDPFAGSGSTLDAARQSGRRAIGIEADEKYCELIAERLSQEVLVS